MIVLVSGFARSGSSLTMQMLRAGGFPVTGIHPMYETPLVTTDPCGDWIDECEGRAVKVLSLVKHPVKMRDDYRVIFLQRDVHEQAKSWVKASGRGKASDPRYKKWVKTAAEHINAERGKAVDLCYQYSCVSPLFLLFEDIIESPRRIACLLADFVGPEFDVQAASKAVRRRSVKCLPGLLEEKL